MELEVAVASVEKEPNFEVKQNPSRVTLPQVKYLSFDVDDRYVPIKKGEVFGVVVLKDTKPELPEELVTPTTVSSTSSTTPAEEEPEPPEPFEYP